MSRYNKAWYEANKERLIARQRQRMGEDADFAESKRARDRTYGIQDRERRNARVAAWRAKHKEKHAATQALHRATKLQATPSFANLFFIEEAYALARLRSEVTGVQWHVDHIVPLQGNSVSGLHVEYNLQVIPASANMFKGNRYV